jgi:uncharacterized protein
MNATTVLRDSRLQERREEILLLASRHGVRNLRIFGSVARGAATAESDLDLLVDLEPGATLIDLGAFQVEMEELLGRRVDVVEPSALHWYIRDRVLAEAVPF